MQLKWQDFSHSYSTRHRRRLKLAEKGFLSPPIQKMPLTSFSTFSTGIVYVHFFLNRTMISMASRYLSFMGQQRWFYCRHYYSSWKKQEAISTEMRVASLTDLTAHDIRNRSFQLLTSKHLQPPSIYIFSITFSFPLSLTHTFFLSLFLSFYFSPPSEILFLAWEYALLHSLSPFSLLFLRQCVEYKLVGLFM